MNIGRHEGRNHQSWIAVVAIVAGLHPVFLEGQAGKPLTLWAALRKRIERGVRTGGVEQRHAPGSARVGLHTGGG
jgi:hypothetical protein